MPHGIESVSLTIIKISCGFLWRYHYSNSLGVSPTIKKGTLYWSTR
jgi:hypothetical protein